MSFFREKLHWVSLMKKLTRQLQRLTKQLYFLNRWTIAFMISLCFIYSIANFTPVYSQAYKTPNSAIFPRNGINGTIWVHPKGNRNSTTTLSRNSRQKPELVTSDILGVAKTARTSKKSKYNWAKLKLQNCTMRNGKRRCSPVNPILQAGVDDNNTLYTFPCGPLKVGNGTFAWGLRQSDRRWNCEVISITHPDWQVSKNSYLDVRDFSITEANTTEENSVKANRKESNIAQQNSSLENQVSVSQAKEPTLVNAYDSEQKLAIDVLVGAVIIQIPQQQAVTVDAGNRYVYAGDFKAGITEPIDVKKAAQSDNIQIFLDSSTWSQDITPLIDEFRSALNLPSSTPSTTDTITVGSACTCKSNNPELSGIELRGVWEKSRRPDVQYECVGKWEGIGSGGGQVRVPAGPRCS
jgi:hypothetical protein